MTALAEIDTTNLLTVLGVLAAVGALISPTSKLQLRFCLTRLDWALGIAILLLIHYLVFAPVLVELGIYYSFGPWRWGLSSSSAVYLLLLVGAVYFIWRTRSPALVPSKLQIFRELVENFAFTKRYVELVSHVEPHLPKLIRMTQEEGRLVNWIDRINHVPLDPKKFILGEKEPEPSAWRRRLANALGLLRLWALRQDRPRTQAREVIRTLITSPELTRYVAVSHPYYCIKLLDSDDALMSDFIDECVDAMLDAPGSRLYVELKNNRNLKRGSRLALPDENRLLRYFFANAAKAARSGVDHAIGESLLRRLNEDSRLAAKLNEPLNSYADQGKFRCPINSGITMFEIMVHEGLHQGVQDHMWLHYFSHFARAITKQMAPPNPDLEYLEWPTPLHYLLSRLVSIALDWVTQPRHVDGSEFPKDSESGSGFDRLYISKEASKCLGEMLQVIMLCTNISDKFKHYLFEQVIRDHNKLQADSDLAELAKVLRVAVIFGKDWPTSPEYRTEISAQYQQLDYHVKEKAALFGQDLQYAYAESLKV
ncbi:hypothetical protein [Pseudomonas aeruginosa]|uniref:hypothetical protein n=1 Tax=Pseudomonas aeruginosa TaxID=287 RepID=UPI00053D0C4E|nr:hypothetical protein [Pseudomonas aeruginosa]SSU85370.1 Uncharacterised protein [Acinetobacter baumannii]HCL2909540.1 hypothetical protein [Pseudomonas aeruginosa 059A]EIU7140306.1 hypothetical protein [Pseudomonas aeruginosa]EKF8204741.1 hypothetical protein [Pseudomonas aeruginosa]EKI0127851.1 hypothetical protein [Pseudomonas aeruginosa]